MGQLEKAILGFAAIGGTILLILGISSSSDEDDDSSPEETPQGFNQDEVRRLRRELKKQLKMKKKVPTEG